MEVGRRKIKTKITDVKNIQEDDRNKIFYFGTKLTRIKKALIRGQIRR